MIGNRQEDGGYWRGLAEPLYESPSPEHFDPAYRVPMIVLPENSVSEWGLDPMLLTRIFFSGGFLSLSVNTITRLKERGT